MDVDLFHLQACATDTKYFDEEFTSQTPKDSFVEAKPISESSQLAFNGFSYAAPNFEAHMAAGSVRDRRSVRYAQKKDSYPGASLGDGKSSKNRPMDMTRRV